MLSESDRRAEFDIGRVGGSPRSDDGTVLSQVDAAVDVAVAVYIGQPVSVGLRSAVISGRTGLVLTIHHQLDSFLSSKLSEEEHMRRMGSVDGNHADRGNVRGLIILISERV